MPDIEHPDAKGQCDSHRTSRALLVSVPVVRHETGLRRDEIFDRVDGRSLLHPALVWVWNFAANPAGELRDLRFYIKEVRGTDWPIQDLALEDIINQILPVSRAQFHSGELIEKFMLTRPTLLALRDELNGNLLGARNCLFTRDNVAAFLKRRWLGSRCEPRPSQRDDRHQKQFQQGNSR
jgi:hypothetical protein